MQQQLTMGPPREERIGAWQLEMTDAQRLQFTEVAGDD